MSDAIPNAILTDAAIAWLGDLPRNRLQDRVSGHHATFHAGADVQYDAILRRHVLSTPGVDGAATDAGVTPPGSLNVSVWARMDSPPGTGYMLAQWTSVAGGRSWAFRFNSSRQLNIVTSASGDGLEAWDPAYTMPLGQWSHLCLRTHDGQLELWVNGALWDSASPPPAHSTNSIRLSAGMSTTSSPTVYPNPWSGRMSEIVLLSRAWTLDEIAWLADRRNQLGSYITTSLIAEPAMKTVQQNSTGNRATVKLLDSSGDPLTGIPAGDVTITAGPEGGTAVPVAVSGSWTERADGRYDFAMPDAMYTGTQRIFIEGTVTGGTVLGDCHQIVGYDRLEPWATPGDIAAIGAVIPGDDAQTLTITCESDSQPVAGVVIRIAGRRLVTDTAGVATVDLDPGSYTARYTPPAGFDSVPDGEIVIAAAPVGVAVTLTPASLPPVDEPLCPVRFVARTQFAEPAKGMSVRVEFLGFESGGSAAGVVVNIPNALSISNDEAYVDTGLYRQARYQATFARSSWGASKSVVFVTPAEGNLIVTEPDH